MLWAPLIPNLSFCQGIFSQCCLSRADWPRDTSLQRTSRWTHLKLPSWVLDKFKLLFRKKPLETENTKSDFFPRVFIPKPCNQRWSTSNKIIWLSYLSLSVSEHLVPLQWWVPWTPLPAPFCQAEHHLPACKHPTCSTINLHQPSALPSAHHSLRCCCYVQLWSCLLGKPRSYTEREGLHHFLNQERRFCVFTCSTAHRLTGMSPCQVLTGCTVNSDDTCSYGCWPWSDKTAALQTTCVLPDSPYLQPLRSCHSGTFCFPVPYEQLGLWTDIPHVHTPWHAPGPAVLINNRRGTTVQVSGRSPMDHMVGMWAVLQGRDCSSTVAKRKEGQRERRGANHGAELLGKCAVNSSLGLPKIPDSCCDLLTMRPKDDLLSHAPSTLFSY